MKLFLRRTGVPSLGGRGILSGEGGSIEFSILSVFESSWVSTPFRIQSNMHFSVIHKRTHLIFPHMYLAIVRRRGHV